jgi:AraC-like DNA-binding protein
MDIVKTYCIQPAQILQPYINHYAIRKFDTKDEELAKPMLADHEMTMVFFLTSKLHEFRRVADSNASGSTGSYHQAACCFIGVQTTTKGFAIFRGDTTILVIHFKASGFLKIFGISPKEVVDCMGNNDEILSKEIQVVHDEMQEGKTFADSVRVLEKYLVKKLSANKYKYKHPGVAVAGHFLIQKKGMLPILELAHHCNMTLKTFELQFTDQVGIGPKHFARLVRFGWVVEIKANQPKKSWTEISNICGYFDQNHLIKDFREFTSMSPNQFLKAMHPLAEDLQSI